MAKKNGEGIYKIVEVVGTSKKSWEDAASNAVATAATTLRDLPHRRDHEARHEGRGRQVSAFRARVSLSFKYEA